MHIRQRKYRGGSEGIEIFVLLRQNTICTEEGISYHRIMRWVGRDYVSIMSILFITIFDSFLETEHAPSVLRGYTRGALWEHSGNTMVARSFFICIFADRKEEQKTEWHE